MAIDPVVHQIYIPFINIILMTNIVLKIIILFFKIMMIPKEYKNNLQDF